MQKIVRQNESESRNKRYSATIDKNICEQLEKEVRRINMTVEEKIYKEVKRRCELPSNAYGIGAWDHHIKIVYELAKKYASEYGANQEIVSLAALLHDVASVTDVTYTEEHHIIGAKIAEELLLQENYPIEKIEQIKITSLLSMVYREKNLSIDEGSKFVMEKLERSYNKMSTKGKKLVKKQYESAKNILK